MPLIGLKNYLMRGGYKRPPGGKAVTSPGWKEGAGRPLPEKGRNNGGGQGYDKAGKIYVKLCNNSNKVNVGNFKQKNDSLHYK